MAIHNLVFDMGNVLLHFEPEVFVDRLPCSAEEKALLRREVFDSPEWVELDRGTLDNDGAMGSICRRLPDKLHPMAEMLVCHWWDPLMPIAGMETLVQTLKQNGYGIYLLSNASLCHHVYWQNLPVSKFFDGVMVSAQEHLLKPQAEIYALLLHRFSLRAEECLFIDDMPVNVEGAIRAGLSGIVFSGDVDALREALRGRSVRCD